MMTRAVLFDLSGTLLSYNREEILRALLEENGITVTRDAVVRAYEAIEPEWSRQFWNLPVTEQTLEQLDRMVLEGLGITEETTKLAHYVTKNWWRMEEQLPPSLVRQAYPDVLPCLKEMKGRRLEMGIVSNIESKERLGRELDLIGLSEFFSVLVASGSVGMAKPAIEIFKLAADQLGVLPREATFVGDDYERDYLGAHSAGMKPVLVDRTGRHVNVSIKRVNTLATIPSMLR